MNYEDAKAFKSAEGIFDCTCFKVPSKAQFPRRAGDETSARRVSQNQPRVRCLKSSLFLAADLILLLISSKSLLSDSTDEE